MEKFSIDSFNQPLALLRFRHNNGQPQDFEVLIDNLSVVARTNDIELWPEQIEELLDQRYHKVIETRLFKGKSNLFEARTFYIGQAPPEVNPKEGKALSGVEIEAKIQEALDKQQAKLAQEQLLKDLRQRIADLEEDVADLEEENQELEQALEEAKANQWNLNGVNIFHALGKFADGAVSNNPKLLKHLGPLGETLKGAYTEEGQQPEAPPANAASFEAVDGGGSFEAQAAPDQQTLAIAQLFAALRQQLNNDQMLSFAAMIDAFTARPHLVAVAMTALRQSEPELMDELIRQIQNP